MLNIDYCKEKLEPDHSYKFNMDVRKAGFGGWRWQFKLLKFQLQSFVVNINQLELSKDVNNLRIP